MSSSGKDAAKPIQLEPVEGVTVDPTTGRIIFSAEAKAAVQRNQERLASLSPEQRAEVTGMANLDRAIAASGQGPRVPKSASREELKRLKDKLMEQYQAEAARERVLVMEQPTMDPEPESEPAPAPANQPPQAVPEVKTDTPSRPSERSKRTIEDVDRGNVLHQNRPSVELWAKAGLEPASWTDGVVQLNERKVTDQVATIRRLPPVNSIVGTSGPALAAGLSSFQQIQNNRQRRQNPLVNRVAGASTGPLYPDMSYLAGAEGENKPMFMGVDIDEDDEFDDVDIDLNNPPTVLPNGVVIRNNPPSGSARIPLPNNAVVNSNSNPDGKFPLPVQRPFNPEATYVVGGLSLLAPNPNDPAVFQLPRDEDVKMDPPPPPQPPVGPQPPQPPAEPPRPPQPPPRPPQPPVEPPPPPPAGPFAQFDANGLPVFLTAFMQMVRANGYIGSNPVNVEQLTTILNTHADTVQTYRTFHNDIAAELGFPEANPIETSQKTLHVIACFKATAYLAAKAERTVRTGVYTGPSDQDPQDVKVSTELIDLTNARTPMLAGLMEQSRLALPAEMKLRSMVDNENAVLALMKLAIKIAGAANISPASATLFTEEEAKRFVAMVAASIQLYNQTMDNLGALGIQPPPMPDVPLNGADAIQRILAGINILRDRIRLLDDSYTATRQVISLRIPGFPDELGNNWYQQDNPQQSVQAYNNRLREELTNRNAALNNFQQRLAGVLQAFGVQIDPDAINFNEQLARAAQNYQNVIRVSPLAALVARVLEDAGVNAQNINEAKSALNPLIANVLQTEELQRQLDEYRELRAILDQTTIPISRLKNFLAKHGRDPEANLRQFMELGAERERVIAYAQFCAVMFRQLFVAIGAVISRVRDTHSTMISRLQAFYAENRNAFVNQTVAEALENLQTILHSPEGYQLRYAEEGPGMFVFLAQPLMAPLFESCESITRMCGSVILQMDPRANRNVRSTRGTLNEVWSMLDQFYLDWAERTVKLAESLVIPENASAARFTQTIDHTLGLLSKYTREGYEASGTLGDKATNGIESMRISMLTEMERLKIDINNRVGRVIVDNTRYFEYQQILLDNETVNPENGMDAMIPLRQYFRHVNAFFVDLVANFNGQEAVRELRSQQLLSQQMAAQQTRLINATRDIRDLKNEKARLDTRLKEVFRIYTTLDNSSRNAVLYMSQRIAQATAGDAVDGKIYESLVNAYQQEIKEEPMNEDVLMGDQLDYRPPKVLEVAKALSGVLELILKRKDGCSKEVKQFLGVIGDVVRKYVEAARSFKTNVPGEDVEEIDTAMTVSVNDLAAAERAVKIIISGFAQRVKAEAAFIAGFNKDSAEQIVRNDTISKEIRDAIGQDVQAAGTGLIVPDLKSAGVVHHILSARFMKLVTQAEKMLSESSKLEEKLGKAEAKIQLDRFKDALYKGLSRELGLNNRYTQGGGKEDLANLVNNGLSIGPADLATAIGGAIKGVKAGKVDKNLLYIPGQNGNGRAGTAGWLGAALSMRRIQPQDKIKVLAAPRYTPVEGASDIKCSYQQIYSFAQQVAGRADLPLNEVLQPICPGMDVGSHEFKILLAHVDRLREIHGDDYNKWWTEETKDEPMPPVEPISRSSNGAPAIRGVPLVPNVEQAGVVADNGEVKGDEEDGNSVSSSHTESGDGDDEESKTTQQSQNKKNRTMTEQEKKQAEAEERSAAEFDDDMGDEEAIRDYERGEQERAELRSMYRTLKNGNREDMDPRARERKEDELRDRMTTDVDRPRPALRRMRSEPEIQMKPLVSVNDAVAADAPYSSEPETFAKSKKRTKRDLDKEHDRLVREDVRRELAGEPPITGFRRRTYTIVTANSKLDDREKAHRAMVTELIDKILAAAGKPVSVEELDRLHRDVFNKQVKLFLEQTQILETCTSGQMFEDLLANYVSYNLCQLIRTRADLMRAKYPDLTAHELMVAQGMITPFSNLIGTQLKRGEATRTTGYFSAKALAELQKDLNETTAVIDKLMRRAAPYVWIRRRI